MAVFDSTEPGKIHYRLETPRISEESAGANWQPTALMEQISQALQDSGKALSFRTVNSCVRGKRETVEKAIMLLQQLGHIRIEQGPRNAHLHHLIHPYPAGDTLTALKAV